jgi:Fe-S cluster assembly protein SufD
MIYESRIKNKLKIISIEVGENEERVYPFVWDKEKGNEFTLSATLVGDNSSLTVLAIFLGTGFENITFNTDVTHIGKHTKSLTLIRSVFIDRSVFNNDGMIRIQKGAKDTNGYFDSKILLFDDAKGRSVPSLEIDENEVKAGHGSTIGRPDENQLFYLRSRGLSEKEAEKLIISGFFEPIIKQLPEVDRRLAKKILKQSMSSPI